MYKTRLVLNKDNLIVLVCITAIVLTFIVNLLTAAPLLYEVFLKTDKKSSGLPINAEIVNQAIEHLNE